MSLVTETPRPSLTISDSDLLNGTAAPEANASNPNLDIDYYLSDTITREIVYVSIVFSLEIPMICLAIYAVCSLIISKHAAPVFLINLLISDLLSIFGILLLTCSTHFITVTIGSIMVEWSSYTGMYFMTCIAVERYIMIARPVWHRSHRSVTCLVCTSLPAWFLPVFIFFIKYLQIYLMLFMSFIPYAVLIMCFIGTCRSLSRSISLTPLKKQLILGPLFFVVMSCTFLVQPFICVLILSSRLYNLHTFLDYLVDFTFSLYVLNPLVDCLLYVFMRSDAENIIRTPLCCSRLNRVRSETGQTRSTDVQLDQV